VGRSRSARGPSSAARVYAGGESVAVGRPSRPEGIGARVRGV